MLFNLKYGNKSLNLKMFNTEQEKELLIQTMFSDKTGREELLKALNVLTDEDFSDASVPEIMFLLYKLREYSVSDKISLEFKCPHCGERNMAEVSIPQIYRGPKKKSEYVKDPLGHPVDNPDNYIDVPEDMPLDEYKEIKRNFKDYCSEFDFTGKTTCWKCGKEVDINLGRPEFCLENMSEKTLGILYKEINSLTYNSHYSYSDIMKMYPFEREILISLLRETIKKENEGQS